MSRIFTVPGKIECHSVTWLISCVYILYLYVLTSFLEVFILSWFRSFCAHVCTRSIHCECTYKAINRYLGTYERKIQRTNRMIPIYYYLCIRVWHLSHYDMAFYWFIRISITMIAEYNTIIFCNENYRRTRYENIFNYTIIQFFSNVTYVKFFII